MRRNIIIAMAVVVAGYGFAFEAQADWGPEDGHKMHFPQLPDPNGWDVSWYYDVGEPIELADDWMCTGTGPVTDIHFWLSAREDAYVNGDAFDGDINVFSSLDIQIWSNNPAGPNGYSIPDQFLWGWNWNPESGDPGNVTMRLYGQGDQGWHGPDLQPPDNFIANDHQNIWQVNITEIADYNGLPFVQQENEIYWLKIHINTDFVVDQSGFTDGVADVQLGWKTSLDQYYDDAVWYDIRTHEWVELVDEQGAPMDLAFVITPEPTSLALLGIGSLALLRRRRGCTHEQRAG